ncbi:MAG: hypothetical protein Q9M22_02685 [Mariprofundaceae bacterium]|nr:hypothetical protein [Mariprofundaceae bacterium]
MAKKSKHYIWLTDGEDLLCAAEEGVSKQGKVLLLTNKRLILIQQLDTKELSDIDDKMWKEFKTVSLRQAFWNSTITVSFSVPTDPSLWVFEKVKKPIAVQAYRLMKNKEVAMREKPKPPKVKPVAEKSSTIISPPLLINESKVLPLPLPEKSITPAPEHKKDQPAPKEAQSLPEKKDTPTPKEDKPVTEKDKTPAKKESESDGLFARMRKKFS